MAEQFLTVEQAAKRLQVHPYTLRRYLREGKIRAVKISRHYRIAESALDLEAVPTEKIAVSPQKQLHGEARRAAILALVGKYPPQTTGSSVERLFAERRLEVTRDEAKYQERLIERLERTR